MIRIRCRLAWQKLSAIRFPRWKKVLSVFGILMIVTPFGHLGPRWTEPDPVAGFVGAGHTLLMEGDYVISPYDELIRRISEEEGHDWRLISAMAYHESRFRSHLVSRRGARGLMQVMPAVARQFGVPVELIADPEINVRLANQLLTSILASLRMPDKVSDRDRMSIMLASYNSGLGHVRDARRLARYYGENPNSWNVVRRYLRLKSLPEYYNHKVVRCGRFTGSRATQAYVNDVLDHYRQYCAIAPL